MKKDNIHVGGQAVIEGVMMRSPEFVSVAVRKPDGKIALKRDPYTSLTKRFKVLGWPFLRGGVVLIESLILGIKALNFSGEMAMSAEEKEKHAKKQSKKTQKYWLAATVVIAMIMGMGLFFYVPLLLTEWIGFKSGLMFNLVDGGIRLAFFLTYLTLISLWREIRRVFEYHGAEHKSIFAYEKGMPLTLDSVKSFTTHHPRCGTSFLLVVMITALLVFMILGKPDHIGERLVRFLFVPIIGGLSYEIIRLASTKSGRWIARTLVAPGLWLQRLTTKEPDDSQLEVALAALKSVLNQDPEMDVEWITQDQQG